MPILMKKFGNKTLPGWLWKNEYFIRGKMRMSEKDKDGISLNSHNIISGGVLRVPRCDHDEFHKRYIEDIKNGHSYYYSENFTPVYRMCFDLDFKEETVEGSELVGDITYRHRVFTEIIKTVRRFYPIDTDAKIFTTIILEAPPKKVDSVPGHCPYTKIGSHMVFPYLYVNKVQALYITEAATSALENEIGKRGLDTIWQNDWSDVCDKVVHQNGNLRMPYSDKPVKCKECDADPDRKNNQKSTCSDPLCEYGKKPEERPYSPIMVLNLDGTINHVMFKTIEKQMFKAINMTSVRTYERNTTKGFQAFVGCVTPDNVVDGKYVSSTVSCSKNGKGTKRKAVDTIVRGKNKTHMEEHDARSKIMIHLAKKCRPQYANLLFKDAFYIESSNNTRRYILNVRGEGSNFCINKGDDHTSSSIYFIFSQAGIRQKCFCKKDIARYPSGVGCNNWESSIMVAPLDKLKVLFPDMPTEYTFMDIVKRTSTGRISKKNADDVAMFGCRRPKIHASSSYSVQTMEEFKKRLEENARTKHDMEMMAEKNKRAAYVSSGKAFDKTNSCTEDIHTITPTKNSHTSIDYTQTRTVEQLRELDDIQLTEYFALHPTQSFAH